MATDRCYRVCLHSREVPSSAKNAKDRGVKKLSGGRSFNLEDGGFAALASESGRVDAAVDGRGAGPPKEEGVCPWGRDDDDDDGGRPGGRGGAASLEVGPCDDDR